MNAPSRPKIYHIVHVDRLKSIAADKYLWCDAEINQRDTTGTIIGMSSIKRRRLEELYLDSHPGLYVGACVPFYFCPRSVMLYILSKGNHPELDYCDGLEPIVHLVADFYDSVSWANKNQKRWAFTLSNAGSYYFEDRCDLAAIDEIDWNAVQSNQWTAPSLKEGKQAEFLMEYCFPWSLIEDIGVCSPHMQRVVTGELPQSGSRPRIHVRPDWYY